MADNNWLLEYMARCDEEGVEWEPVVSGNSRLRALAVFLICTLARPKCTHRLWWK